MRYFRRTLGTIAVPVSLFILVGCGSAAAPDGTGQTTAAQQTTTSTQQKPTLNARAPRGPAAMVLRSALADLTLDATQKKTIQGIIAQLGPVQQKTRGQFSHALADAVRSGKVDPASFTTEYAAIEQHVKDRIAKQTSALDQLHATLDSADRGLLVDQLKTKLASRPRFSHRGMWRRGHWRRAQANGAAQPMARGMRREGPRMMRGFIAHKLGLSQAQIDQLRKQAPAFDAAKKGKCAEHMAARRERATKMLDAFVSNDFKAENLINADAIAKRASKHAEMRVEHLARLVSVLTPAQRTQLATMLDRRAGAKP